MYLSFVKSRFFKDIFLVFMFFNAAQLHAEENAEKNPDPWQGFNRAIFSFNDTVDKWLLKPIARGYRFVTPNLVERGIANVFDNVQDVPNTLNGALQGNFKESSKYMGRFLVNSTLGVGGLFDVAKYMKLPATEDEDFGQTLAVWGLEKSRYLVLPFFGPSTLRDGLLGRPVDWFTNPTNYIEHVPTDNTVTGVSIINTRASLLDLEKNLTGDKYIFIRDVYLQRRDYLINNGEVVDTFGTDDFEL
jgi:phospholipid-binding lipoprotein MlaA